MDSFCGLGAGLWCMKTPLSSIGYYRAAVLLCCKETHACEYRSLNQHIRFSRKPYDLLSTLAIFMGAFLPDWSERFTYRNDICSVPALVTNRVHHSHHEENPQSTDGAFFQLAVYVG